MFKKALDNIETTLLIKVVLLIVIGIFLVPFVLYLLHFGSATFSNEIGDWNSYAQIMSGTIGPFIALLTLLVTSWIAIRFNQFQKKQSVIQLFKEFRSHEMWSSRNRAWSVRKNWNKADNLKYKEEFIQTMVNEDRDIEDEITKDTKAVFDLFAFYSMLGTYEEQNETMEMVDFFYYPWWRDFLFEVAVEYDKLRAEKAEIAKAKNEPVRDLEIIKFTPKIIHLENILALDKTDDTTVKEKSQ